MDPNIPNKLFRQVLTPKNQIFNCKSNKTLQSVSVNHTMNDIVNFIFTGTGIVCQRIVRGMSTVKWKRCEKPSNGASLVCTVSAFGHEVSFGSSSLIGPIASGEPRSKQIHCFLTEPCFEHQNVRSFPSSVLSAVKSSPHSLELAIAPVGATPMDSERER